ncbi:hypothetical protein [Hymenobacter sp. APR13]|jgi:hypothetical protein|uniref:hypothetical protein n=1 Tax=Hymenobacter sp. APR13 TaxID=1356852 RepID=UPI0004E07470|nr:hypothetical protein [Hymenobacter sp. APR13]AII50530.1 hypothetical protein N008_00840 [Hymenobacter sp. APR13]
MTIISPSASEKHAFCQVEYDARNHWLRATWQGFVNPQQALQSIVSHLDLLSSPIAPLFLNDNSRVLNPWFDSLTWLRYVWESTNTPPPPCVAHVMQPGASANVGDLDTGWTSNAGTDLQLFESVCEAEEWLHTCQHGLR